MTKDLFGIGFDMFFSELYKIVGNKVTFVGLRGRLPQSPPGSAIVIHAVSTEEIT